jgi:hypothetical protein
MVGTIERSIAFIGIFSLYSYGIYNFMRYKSMFSVKHHASLILQGQKIVNDLNNPNLKFISSAKDKVLFVYGIDNANIEKNNLKIIDKIIDDFPFNYFIYEKDPQ